jgi:hypothetical protein
MLAQPCSIQAEGMLTQAQVRATPHPGGSVKRSLAMVFLGCGAAIAKACGLDAATHD